MSRTDQARQPKFEQLNLGEERMDLASRREVKFALAQVDLGKLRSLLQCNCRRLVHNHPVSTVRSIYFDDFRLSACRANLDGLGRRTKLRLRWYDSLRPGVDFFAEIKWRRGHVTGKHRLQLRSNAPLGELSYREILSALHQSTPPHLLKDVLRYSEPIVVVEYQREHFATDDGIRLTLDYDIAYYDQTGRHGISTAFRKPMPELVVLEGKTPVGRESELRRWLHPYTPYAGRCSKYVHGCVQIGLIAESEL